MKPAQSPTARTFAATIIVGVQGLLAVTMAFALLAVPPYHRLPLFASALSSSRETIALTLVLSAFVLSLIAFGVAGLEGWSRPAAILAEALIVGAAIYRSPLHPVWSTLAVALALAVVALLHPGAGGRAKGREREDPSDHDEIAAVALGRP